MQLKIWQAVNSALRDAMREDSRVVVIGEDVAGPGGPFGTTRGLLRDFGSSRVRDTPISEGAIMACAAGAAMVGLKPVVEIMYIDFLALAMDPLVNQAAKYRFFTRDQAALSMVVHALYGGRASYGAQHSQSLEAWLCHVPGLKVAFPSTPQDEYDVLRAAIQDPDPVVVITSIALLRQAGEVEGQRPAEREMGKARVVREGDRLTVVSYGPAVAVCEQAIQELGLEVELIDLRWLQPWDYDLVRRSLEKTARLLVVHDAVEQGGWGAEIVARLTQNEFWSLDAPPRRIGAMASSIPVASRDWSPLLPNVEQVKAAIEEIVRI